MREHQKRSRCHSDNDNRKNIEQARIDLALLFMTDLHVGAISFHKQKAKGSSLDLVYEIGGVVHRRSYLSPLSWRAIMLFALDEGEKVTVHEMDRPGRYQRLFPRTLMHRLDWHARLDADFPPVARLYDPNGYAVMLLTRSRFCGHAVDTLHSLGEGKPVFQPLWISDIMALRPMLGIEFIRDETFTATLPISAYIKAAAKSGRIPDAPELSELDLSGAVPSLPSPEPAQVISRIFDQQCREHPQMEQLRGRTIYEDYKF
ncbi:DUF2958 domain-containing protein [Rhizobium sp. Leaf262]|uniref:DUF2958 domain-containing protein n=1 Tax=Rhizobium sp. Leaf262 TaxID=1736312 RepID=UPI00071448DD|nr:DUF2958 domain-containing protein [Rhizobium sp. Leaf262]KQO79013.1 hypothetical protein ASF29_04640 [Rhizobium sp. Leaf262]